MLRRRPVTGIARRNPSNLQDTVNVNISGEAEQASKTAATVRLQQQQDCSKSKTAATARMQQQ
jgi:hypothetical protein